ncbi:MAG: hypothetical protein HYX93_04860 [Chloroflexi bacterium]|nr:hypothetical protein [Chloroflexota bacterium]
MATQPEHGPTPRGSSGGGLIGRAFRLFLNLLVLILVVALIVGFWGARAVSQDRDTSLEVTVLDGAVQIAQEGLEGETDLAGSVPLGGLLRVPAGSAAYLSFSDGSSARMKGPGELVLRRSHTFVQKPAPLEEYLERIGLVSKLTVPRVRQEVEVTLLSGEMLVEAAPAASPDSVFRLWFPAGVVQTEDAVLRVKATPEETTVQVGLGEASVGLLTHVEGEPALLAIPSLPTQREISAPSYTGPSATELVEGVADALPMLSGAFLPTNIDGIEYTPLSGDVPFFVGYTTGTAPGRDTGASIHERALSDAPAPPSAQVRRFTDADFNGKLPTGWTAHILPGNALTGKAAGSKYLATATVSKGRLMVNGLPLGVDVGPYLTDLPYILSIHTAEGEAVVTYLPEATAPPTTADEAPKSLVRSHRYFEDIPTPREVSTDPGVVGTNAGFAGATALVVMALRGMVNALLRREERTLGRAFAPLGRLLRGAFGGVTNVLTWLRRRFPLGILEAGVVLLAYGLIYSFLAQKDGVFGTNGVFILVSMSLTIGLVSLSDPYGRAIAGKIWRIPTQAGAYPGNLLIALGSVGTSRLLSLTPGLIFGTPGGLRELPESLGSRDRRILAIAGFAGTATLAVVSWGATLYLPTLETSEEGHKILQLMGPLASQLQDILLLIFVACLQRMAFGLLPMPGTVGNALLRWNKMAWVLIFGVMTLALWHFFLNKDSDVPQMVSENTLAFAAAMAGFALLMAAIGLYLRFRKSREPQVATAAEGDAAAT